MDTEVDVGIIEDFDDGKYLSNACFPTKLGGKPAWLHLGKLPTTETLKCSKCNNPKIFLCQVYAPLDEFEHTYRRTIYVFICRTKSCSKPNDNSHITILRSQLPNDNEFYPHEPQQDLGDDEDEPEILPKNCKLCLICGCLGPFKCGRCKNVNYCSSQHQLLHWKYHKLSCSNNKTIAAQVLFEFIPDILFPEYSIFLNLFNDQEGREMEKSIRDDIMEMNMLHELMERIKIGQIRDFDVKKYKKRNSKNVEKDMQKFLKDVMNHVRNGNYDDLEFDFLRYTKVKGSMKDKYFQKFIKECQNDPTQVIRYKRKGQVLWIADTENIVKEQLENIPKCELCGEQRQFEFQIMPQMLNYLEDANIDWGTIAVYTCPKSCALPADKGYIEEFCIKQDNEKMKTFYINLDRYA